MQQFFYRDGRSFEGKPSKVIDADRATQPERQKCHRCGGAGGSDCWKHTGWRCYQCGGSGLGGTKIMKLYSAEKLAKLNAAQDKARTKRDAKRAAEKEVRLQAQRAEFAEWLETYDGKGATHVIKALDGFGDEIKGRTAEIVQDIIDVFRDQRPLTEKQISTLFQIRDRTARTLKERENSEHIGEIGEAITIEGDCKLIWEDPWGAYGWKGIYTIKTAAGHVFKYCGGTSLGNGWVSLTGTIKAHEEYKGVKQTAIKRPRKIKKAA